MLTIKSATGSSPTTLCLYTPFRGLPAPTSRVSEYHPGYTKEMIPLPPEAVRPEAGWNKLDFPVWGLSRAAEMHVLLTGDDWATLRGQLAAARSVTVAWDDDAGGTGSATLYVVDAVPVSDSRATVGEGDDTQVLYWLTLTDVRDNWCEAMYTSAATYTDMPPATWGDLLEDLILQATGVTVSSTLIDGLVGGYPLPNAYFSPLRLRGRNACALADAVAALLQLRILVSPTGGVTVQDAAAARTTLAVPVTDLAAGGYRKPSDTTAATLQVTQYDQDGIVGAAEQSVGGGVDGDLAVWLPFGPAGWGEWAAGYALWTDIDVPDMGFAGFVAHPTSSAVDRWVLDHENGITWWLDGCPWPLVGSPGGAVYQPERLLNACRILDTNGCLSNIRFTWRKPDGTIYCETLEDCPVCADEPAPAPCP